MENKKSIHRVAGQIEFDIIEIKEDYAISKMPVKKGMLNPYGTVNAGAMIWMADVTASALTYNKVGQGFPIAINLFANLHRNLKEGEITAEARITRSGRRITSVRTILTGDNGKLLAEVLTSHIQSQDNFKIQSEKNRE